MERKYFCKLPMAFSGQAKTWQPGYSEVYPIMLLNSTVADSPASLSVPPDTYQNYWLVLKFHVYMKRFRKVVGTE